jgi:YbbR domain-containing protein
MNMVSNLWLKLTALALAGAIWLVVSADRREAVIERAFDVPVALVGLPRDLIITTPVPDAVNVRLRGRLSTLRALSSQNLEATLDLSAADPGELSVAIRPQDLNIPDHVEVVSIAPARIPFRLEPRRQKFVPIRPYPVGELDDGVTITGITIEPAQALVSGPASLIRDFSEVVTERIVISGRTSSFATTVGIVSDRSLIRVVEPQSARVTIGMRTRQLPDDEEPAMENFGQGSPASPSNSQSRPAPGGAASTPRR